MKKILLAISALVLGLASCTQKELTPITPDGENVTVSFTASIPGADAATRAYSDGLTVNNLHYYVYQNKTVEGATELEYLDWTETIPISNLKATVDLELARGKEYTVVFWADAETAPYTYDPETQILTVSYEGASAQDENRDAFYACVPVTAGETKKEVTLTRPFAQINIGTNDFDKAKKSGRELKSTGMVVAGVANKINLVTGISDGNTTATFTVYDIPAANAETYPVPGYRYIGMNYVLTAYNGVPGTEKSTVEITFNAKDTNESEFPAATFGSVPVQRNYRTNIYGSLLTNNSQFEITIEDGFSGANNVQQAWDGVSTTEVTPVTKEINGVETTVYVINTPAELAWIAEQTNNEQLLDAYIELNEDIDLGNQNWTPIANGNRADAATSAFTGTFDGKGHTVSNLKSSATEDGFGCGLISVAREAEIKNLTISGGELTSGDFAGAVVGYIGDASTVENCKNIGVKVSATGAAGGVVGRAYGNACVIRNCENSGEISGSQKVGGIAGIASVGSFTIDNCKNSGTIIGGSNAGCSGILGYAGKPGTISNCENTGNVSEGNLSSKYSGGICGYLQSDGIEITSCINKGIVNGLNAGGIFGAPGNKTYSTYISNCENYGEIKAGDIAGGIVGSLCNGELSSCQNYASVTAVNYAGGIAGAKSAGLMKGNLGGSAAITVTNTDAGTSAAGRILGVCRNGSGELLTMELENDGATNAHENGLGSIGAIGSFTTLASVKVINGTLIGTPKNNSGSVGHIYIEGAEWTAFPGEIGHWTASPNSSAWKKEEGSGVKKVTVNGKAYTNLADAIAAQTKTSVLEILDETVWPAATPVYYEGQFYANITEGLKAAYMAGAGDKVISLRPGSNVGSMSHCHVADNLTVYGNGARIVSSGDRDFEVDTYKYSRTTGNQDQQNGEFLESDITLNIYSLNGTAAWGQRNTEHKITLNFYNCKNMSRIYFSGARGTIDINLEKCSFDRSITDLQASSCCVKSDSKGSWNITDCTFNEIPEAVAMTNGNGFGLINLTGCTFTNCGTKASLVNDAEAAWASTVRSLGRTEAEINIDSCTFTNNNGSELNSADIVIGELRPEKPATNTVRYSIKNTNGTLRIIKPHGAVAAIDATDIVVDPSMTYQGTNAD